MGDNRVVGIADSLSVERPCIVLRLREITHCSVPKSPPGFDFPIRLRVVAACGSASRACDCSDGSSEWRTSGDPRRKCNSSRSRGTRVEAWRSGRGIRITVLVKLSIRARASVSPVLARPWPWKSIA